MIFFIYGNEHNTNSGGFKMITYRINHHTEVLRVVIDKLDKGRLDDVLDDLEELPNRVSQSIIWAFHNRLLVDGCVSAASCSAKLTAINLLGKV